MTENSNRKNDNKTFKEALLLGLKNGSKEREEDNKNNTRKERD